MSERIYLDNSATSYPKPPEVTEAMVQFARECGASAGRGAYAEAKACGEMLATCRRRCRAVRVRNPEGWTCSQATSL